MNIDLYYTLSSPWAYLGGPRLIALVVKTGAQLTLKPFDFQKVVPITGGVPLRTRPLPRQQYHALELDRWRQHLNLPMNLKPRFYPPDRSPDNKPATRLVLAAKAQGQDAMALSHAILRGLWAEEKSSVERESLIAIANDAGFDGAALAMAGDAPEIMAEYERNTEEALRLGVFGAPTYVIEGELFWGQDRLDFVERRLARGA
jgi:2-hydroxychromene-2-carboxylate isomerase